MIAGLLAGALVPAVPAAASRCAAYGPPTTVAAFPALAVSESSGLAVSRTRPGVLYTHDDSGGAAVLHAITPSGAVLGGHPLPKGWNTDWEALESGPCPAEAGGGSEPACLYVGDLGDNRSKRPRVVIRVVAEPPARAAVGTALELLATWKLTYPDGPQDAEALLVHPKTGSVDVLTKRLSGDSRVFRVPADMQAGTEQAFLPMGTLPVSTWADDPLVTGAAWNAEGDTVAVRTYTSIGVWAVDPCAPDGWWDRPPDQVVPAPPSRQGESLAIGAQGQVYSTSEGHPMPLFAQPCLDPSPPRGCPAVPAPEPGPAGSSLPAPPTAPPPGERAPTTGCTVLGRWWPGGSAALVGLCSALLVWARREGATGLPRQTAGPDRATPAR